MFFYLSQVPQWLAENGHAVWADWLSFLRVFQYITFRTAGAAVTALLLCWWLGPKIIALLKWLKFGQEYSDKAEEAGGLHARVLSKKIKMLSSWRQDSLCAYSKQGCRWRPLPFVW